MRKGFFSLVTALAALPALLAQAHTDLAKASPAEGEVLSEAPDELRLDFSAAVQLVEATVSDSEGRQLNESYQAPQAAARSFVVPLPPLPEGEYSVSWTVVGEEDGHTMLGDYSFRVE